MNYGAIFHDCHGIRQDPTNPDAKVSFQLNVETNSSDNASADAIIPALSRAVVDAVAKHTCPAASSIFRPEISVQGSCESSTPTTLTIEASQSSSCFIYQGTLLVRYHLPTPDPTLDSLEAVITHNLVIHSSRQAIRDSIDDILQQVNNAQLLQQQGTTTTTTIITNMSYSGAIDEPFIDVFDETTTTPEDTTADDADAVPDPTAAPAVATTPSPTRNDVIVVAATQIDQPQDDDDNTGLIVGTTVTAIVVIIILLLLCCWRRRNASRNNTTQEFEKSNHTEDEEEASIPEPEPQPRPSSVLAGFRSSAASTLDVHRCHSVTCGSCGTCGYGSKKTFPWSTVPKSPPKSESVQVDDDLPEEEEDVAAMQQMDQVLFGSGDDNAAGPEFISAVGQSAVHMNTLYDIVQQETRGQQEHTDSGESAV